MLDFSETKTQKQMELVEQKDSTHFEEEDKWLKITFLFFSLTRLRDEMWKAWDGCRAPLRRVGNTPARVLDPWNQGCSAAYRLDAAPSGYIKLQRNDNFC